MLNLYLCQIPNKHTLSTAWIPKIFLTWSRSLDKFKEKTNDCVVYGAILHELGALQYHKRAKVVKKKV